MQTDGPPLLKGGWPWLQAPARRQLPAAGAFWGAQECLCALLIGHGSVPMTSKHVSYSPFTTN